MREVALSVPGANAELKGASFACEPGQVVDSWVDDRRVEHLGRGFVVSRSDTLVVEISVAMRHVIGWRDQNFANHIRGVISLLGR